ncbi:error-prone DNA polymerase, DnaE-like protein [Candidatus Koribacter versatilis Ellin345]|uniref:DNA polymerase III subunit alpha n=1 Tax=Koribacter versatilis (strain Ellin345) TaxID=204669 RepID=Q1IJA3_KORVE|nr:error-prone DNA polymerase [Candidatus Koribacter versatilis]ABF43047.1 error-prone DNA polymerase, DnaE-like protein [Candidatus Koribacter versatilis Ellin345]
MTAQNQYIELHANSAFSFLRGASLPETLIFRAQQLEYPAMALMDGNGVYGSARFHLAAKPNGVRAHVGSEIAVRDLGERMAPAAWLPHQWPAEPVRLPLLCESREGYQNLCRMVTRLKMREPSKAEGAAVMADVEEFARGLVCLTGGDEGPLASALARGGEPEGHKTVEHLVRMFGRENVFVELQRHGLREQEWRNQAAVRIARSLQLPILATNGVRYADEPEREIADLFTAIRHHVALKDAGRLLAQNSCRYLRPTAEMARLFRDLPEAVANTWELSQRLTFELDDLGYQFPIYPTPDGESMDSFLEKRVQEGVIKRYGAKNEPDLYARAQKQVARELALIKKLGLAGYFLIVWDIIRFCQQNDILVQGRGSAANSAVCYALEITAVDPVGMELLFERFLSEARGEWPDIDLDLPSGDKREQAIQYVYTRYGHLGAAMTANVITYRGKSAAREVGKALGFDVETLNKLTKLVSTWEWRGPNDTLENQFESAGFEAKHPHIAKYLDLCSRIQDLPRHLGQHSGGMVICQGQLDSVVPIEPASMPGRSVVQWDKDDCADMHIIKVDLLGLGMMAVIKDCVDLVPRHYGVPVDLAQLPQNDGDVYRTLQKADTVGMFQVESRAQMASLPRNYPTRFYDIVVQVAIIRPGPIVGNMANPYMRRRQKKEEVTYYHPLLEPVLKRTLGVPLFQEQLLRMAMIVANFSGTEAEELRRALGMRRSTQRMRELGVKLRAGMTENGFDPKTQEEIIQSISSFALYGFPESHAASFALIAYASAYFKVHYLAAFTAAILNNQPMGFYSPAVLVKDAQRHGLRVLPVDVQRSVWDCTVEHAGDERKLRLGLRYVRGLRQETAEILVKSRENHGPFASSEDLGRRVPLLNRKELVALAQIGALNWVGGTAHRRDALWQVERVSRRPGPLLQSAEEEEDVSPLAQMNWEERLVADFNGTGLTVGKHPMTYHRERLAKMRVLSAEQLQVAEDGRQVRIAGCVIARQRPGTAKGFVFLSIEDETGIANAIISPQLYEQNRVVVFTERFLVVEGKLQNQDGVIHVRAQRVQSLHLNQVAAPSHDFH